MKSQRRKKVSFDYLVYIDELWHWTFKKHKRWWKLVSASKLMILIAHVLMLSRVRGNATSPSTLQLNKFWLLVVCAVLDSISEKHFHGKQRHSFVKTMLLWRHFASNMTSLVLNIIFAYKKDFLPTLPKQILASVIIVVAFNEGKNIALLLESFLIKMKLLHCQNSVFTLEKRIRLWNKICFL